MSTRFVCDWCGAEFEDRKNVASADLTIGNFNEQCHICVSCAPDHVRQHFPEEPKPVTDGGTAAQERGRSDVMEKITLRMPDGLLDAVEDAVDRGEHPNRSHAIREACRAAYTETDGGVSAATPSEPAHADVEQHCAICEASGETTPAVTVDDGEPKCQRCLELDTAMDLDEARTALRGVEWGVVPGFTTDDGEELVERLNDAYQQLTEPDANGGDS